MKFNRNWLHEEFVDLSHISDREYVEKLNSLGWNVTAYPQANGDTIVDFALNPHRPDCCCVMGLARESAAAFGLPVKHHDPSVRGSDDSFIFEYLDVEVPADALCNRYSARMLTNVRVGPSPEWLRHRLMACGICPVNNITDIANYVMLAYGQPIHAFDFRSVSSGMIMVRETLEGETLTTADGILRQLPSGTLVAADGWEPISLAGIMGCENTGIAEDTTTVILEAASFSGTAIRQTALELGIHTDASDRYTLSPDPMLTIPSLERVCELVEALGCGTVLDGTIDILNYIPEPRSLPFDPDAICRMLGAELSCENMIRTLELLEIHVEGNTLLLPSFRPDLNRTEDIVRELARFTART